ncbi:HAMP domain-containing sensor histidine kinase [Phyllobacterium sp. SB3]|uniref:sensor histidine kinase n=1 Tax=Phyllobacterium sp. SB3 TaxID=3156073 RepID=UPI0032AF6C87
MSLSDIETAHISRNSGYVGSFLESAGRRKTATREMRETVRLADLVRPVIRGAVRSFSGRSILTQIAIPILLGTAIINCSLLWLSINAHNPVRNYPIVLSLLVAQLILSLLITMAAARKVAGSLSNLVTTADELVANGPINKMDESGPREVAEAARAFNDMCDRMQHHLEARVQMLSAFAHDMQTPITRMRLRTELADDFPERDKLLRDLGEMERLVRDGITYAKSSFQKPEESTAVDLRALIESIVFDYEDTGRDVSLVRTIDAVTALRPVSLRRVVTNLIDNALKYAGAAEISVYRSHGAEAVISVLDRGPGIAEELLAAVRQPFVKLKGADSETAGIGLGLAIAEQLAGEMGAVLQLGNREGGGLRAEIILKSKIKG